MSRIGVLAILAWMESTKTKTYRHISKTLSQYFIYYVRKYLCARKVLLPAASWTRRQKLGREAEEKPGLGAHNVANQNTFESNFRRPWRTRSWLLTRVRFPLGWLRVRHGGNVQVCVPPPSSATRGGAARASAPPARVSPLHSPPHLLPVVLLLSQPLHYPVVLFLAIDFFFFRRRVHRPHAIHD